LRRQQIFPRRIFCPVFAASAIARGGFTGITHGDSALPDEAACPELPVVFFCLGW
jgi:hypothetical protein